jgi:hypothetical protein
MVSPKPIPCMARERASVKAALFIFTAPPKLKISAGLGHLLTNSSIQQGSFDCAEKRVPSQKGTL